MDASKLITGKPLRTLTADTKRFGEKLNLGQPGDSSSLAAEMCMHFDRLGGLTNVMQLLDKMVLLPVLCG